MDNFDATLYFRNQYLKEAESADDTSLSTQISNVIPENTSIEDFATSVSEILMEDYGKHNVEKFMEALHGKLGINESQDGINLRDEEERISKVVKDNHDLDNSVTLFTPEDGRVEIKVYYNLEKEEGEAIKKTIEAQGYKVPSYTLAYDDDFGDRDNFPRFKIEK